MPLSTLRLRSPILPVLKSFLMFAVSVPVILPIPNFRKILL